MMPAPPDGTSSRDPSDPDNNNKKTVFICEYLLDKMAPSLRRLFLFCFFYLFYRSAHLLFTAGRSSRGGFRDNAALKADRPPFDL